MTQLPNFLIVGFPKCGTHALLRNMGKHPEIYTHPHELHFFGGKNASIEKYKSFFSTEKPYRGGKSPLYIVKTAAMRQIARTLPDAKIIICVRHPVHMLHSFYNFRVWEYENGLPSGFDQGEVPFERIVLEDLDIKSMRVAYGRYMDYITCNVLPFFNRQNVCIVIQERMWVDMTREMNRVYEFLGALKLQDI